MKIINCRHKVRQEVFDSHHKIVSMLKVYVSIEGLPE